MPLNDESNHPLKLYVYTVLFDEMFHFVDERNLFGDVNNKFFITSFFEPKFSFDVILTNNKLKPMDLASINYLAVVVAALSCFVVGYFWYSPLLFGNVWLKEAGLSREKIAETNMVLTFGLSFILTLIISFNLAAFLGTDAGLVWGITAGALAGIGWVAASLGVLYLFERKSLKLFLINAGYQAVTYIIAGGIIGVWQ